jgi:tripartite ATP-independent transporter DctP family solute receptor
MKTVRSFAGAMMVAALAMASPSQAQPVSLTFASSINPEHTSSLAMDMFKAEVARRTKDTVEIEIAPGMKLGGAMEILQKVRTDAMFGTWVSVAFVSRLVPQIDALTLPFVFRNYDDAMRTVNGPVGKRIEAELDAKGFTTLGWMELGARHVLNARRPLKTLDDVKGLRIRTQPGETYMATFRALGAIPLALDPKDIYLAQQQGNIDALEIPYSIVNSEEYKFYEHLKYISDTSHILEFMVVIANKKAFMRLTPEQQKAIRDAARLATAQQRKMADVGEMAALAALKAKGLQFDPVPPETRVALRKATAGVVNSLKGQIGADLVDNVFAAAARTAKR